MPICYLFRCMFCVKGQTLTVESLEVNSALGYREWFQSGEKKKWWNHYYHGSPVVGGVMAHRQ